MLEYLSPLQCILWGKNGWVQSNRLHVIEKLLLQFTI